MPRILVTPPTLEPVELVRAKEHLRTDLSSSAEDALIEILVSAAREWAEGQTSRALITQTWRESFDRFPAGGESPWRQGYGWRRHPLADQLEYDAIRLGLAPVQSVSSVKYIDATGAEQTMPPSDYVVDTASLPAKIRPAYGVTWPDTRAQANAVTVEYVAGYGDDPASVPAPIRAAMLLVLGDLYANREAQIVGTIVNENPTAKALLGPYRVLEVV